MLKHSKIIIYASVLMSIFFSCHSNYNLKNRYMDNNLNKTVTLFEKGQRLPNIWFTGDAFITPLVAKDQNNEFSIGSVWFEKGARTHWHTHPKGQTLIVTEGQGLYQEKGKLVQIIKKGDVVIIPEDTEHWHGASADSEMIHIAITNYKNDEQVTWLNPVTDEEYKQ